MQLIPDMIELFILLFAVILLSDTIVGLQNQLDVLCKNATALELQVNLDKSNIVIFRNGGFIARREEWFYNGQKMSVIGAYKYLGIFFTTKLTFTKALEEMAGKARKCVVSICRTLRRLGDVGMMCDVWCVYVRLCLSVVCLEYYLCTRIFIMLFIYVCFVMGQMAYTNKLEF